MTKAKYYKKKNEVEEVEPQRLLYPHEYAAFYAVYYSHDVPFSQNFAKQQHIAREKHLEFLSQLTLGPEWRIVDAEAKRTRLMHCKCYPILNGGNREGTCRQFAICPWCYASSVARLYGPLWEIVQQPEYANMWLTITETTTTAEVAQPLPDEPREAFVARYRSALCEAFRLATRRRSLNNKNESKLKNPVLASVRYADISYIPLPLPTQEGERPRFVKSHKREHFTETATAKAWPAIDAGYKVINRAFVLTEFPAAARLGPTSNTAQINKKLTAKSFARLLGVAMQQSKINNVVHPDFRCCMAYAKHLTNHKVFTTNGAFRGIDDQTNTTAVNRVLDTPTLSGQHHRQEEAGSADPLPVAPAALSGVAVRDLPEMLGNDTDNLSEVNAIELASVYADMVRAAEADGKPTPMTLQAFSSSPEILEAFHAGAFASEQAGETENPDE